MSAKSMLESVPSRQRSAIIFLALVMSIMLNSCGTNQPSSFQSTPQAHASIGCSGANVPCSAKVEVPLITVDGSDPASYGLPVSCALTAGNQTMNFTTATTTANSAAWFGATPTSGSLQPSGNTTVAVSSISAANVSGRNIGQVSVSASGYSTNSQMAVELNCNVAAGSCVVAYSCNPSAYPLP